MTRDDIIRMAREAGLPYIYQTGEVANLGLVERFATLVAAAALAEPVQEPVAWRTFDGEGGYDYWAYEDNENYHEEYVKRNGEKYASWVEPLYTAPPQRKPLTDEEIERLLSEHEHNYEMIKFARAIERAHGIGEKE